MEMNGNQVQMEALRNPLFPEELVNFHNAFYPFSIDGESTNEYYIEQMYAALDWMTDALCARNNNQPISSD